MIIDFNRYNGGGGSTSGVTPEQVQEQIESALTPYWESGETKDYVDEAVSGISLDGYWTSAQTQSAITAVEDHLFDVEEVTASALTELHEGLVEVSGRPSPDMSLYTPTSGFSTINGSAITNGGNIVIQSDLTDYWTSGETKEYVDSAITGVQDQIDVMDEVVATSLVDLNDRIVELSGSSVDLSAYYTSAQTEDAISAATSGKADAANVTANTSMIFPKWNAQGIITGTTGNNLTRTGFYLNGTVRYLIKEAASGDLGDLYAPTTPGTAGQILVSAGKGIPVWSAVTFPDVSNYVTSAQVETQIDTKAAAYTPTSGFSTINGSAITNGGNIVIQGGGGDVTKAYVDSADTALQDQIDVIDEVIPAAIVDLNTRKVESTSVHTIWRGTQAEYDAITTKDASTLYIIL